LKIKSKVNGLEILETIKKKKFKIPFFFSFEKKNYKKNLIKIYGLLKKDNIILRSSAYNEDQPNQTNAGLYDSVIIKKKTSLPNIEKKIKFFLRQFKNIKDKIIVQQFIDNVQSAGVIFTLEPNNNLPYYIISYDTSGKTNLITSGKKISEKKLIIYKNAIVKNKKIKKIINAIKLIEDKIKNNRLDIEFAFKKDQIYIFQVRALPNPRNLKAKLIDSALINIEKKIIKLQKPRLKNYGKLTLFSNMSDWNPAEMIGEKPYPLAMSLYKELITNEVWAEQRANYGYQDCRPNILMFDFLGFPFIDLRTDFNSFLPSNLNKNIKEKIINNNLNQIIKNPNLHDKVEFKIVETCYTCKTKERLKKYLNNNEIHLYAESLLELTNNIIINKKLYEDIKKIKNFENELDDISKSKLSKIEKIYFLLNLIKKKGTLPFAGIARCAFIAKKILDDLCEKKIIKKQNLESFYTSIKTITSQIILDIHKVKKNRNYKKNFIRKYGHIRPSTYDISQKNYSEGFNSYFNLKDISDKKNKTKNFSNKFNITSNLQKIGYLFNERQLVDFAKKAIEQREYAKFIYSKSLNLIFLELIKLGNEIGLQRKDLNFINIDFIKNAHSNLSITKLKEELGSLIRVNKKKYRITSKIMLPELLKNKYDIYSFEPNTAKPNFITEDCVEADLCNLDSSNNKNFNDKIVLIKSADPGYDFIFNHKIKGLITAYGGSNSHMAIRCIELNIPAAIGIGSQQYEKLKKVTKIILDCKKKKIF
jgi:glutamine kinase